VDEATRKAIRILDELVCERAPGPYVIDAEYARLIERAEKLTCNQDGADKTWVERLVQNEREFWRRVKRVEDR
jgi:hypothetical protein